MKRTALFGLAFVSMACGGGDVISSRAQADTSSAEFVFDGTFGYPRRRHPSRRALSALRSATTRRAFPIVARREDSVARVGDHRVRERGRRRRDRDSISFAERSRRGGVQNSVGERSRVFGFTRATRADAASGIPTTDQNFHFAIAQITTDPIVHFKSDFTTSTEGGVHAGEAIR